jgi:HSP20 family protein
MSNQTAGLTTDKQATMQAPSERALATRDETRYIAPPVDIYETETDLIVVADLPGVDKDGVDVQVEDNILTIKATASYAPPPNLLVTEFNLQGYYRQFQLTDEVDQSKIAGEARNGVLTITLPKAEKAKPRQIRVQLE